MTRGGFREHLARHLSLRMRLAMGTALLLLAVGGLQVLFINWAVRKALPPVIQMGFFMVVPGNYPYSSRLLPIFPGKEEASPPGPVTWYQVPNIMRQAEQNLQEQVLQAVQRLSLLSLLVTALVGGAATYWLSGRALQPVRALSHAVARVDADRLHTRVAVPPARDEVRNLAEAFNDLLDRLETAFLQQQRFVSDAAHELRTPLATLQASLEVLHLSPAATDPATEASLAAMARTLHRMETMVEHLLLLARGEPQTRREPVLLAPLVEAILDDLHPLAAEHEVQLALQGEADLEVLGDETLLAVALRNLVDNAVRYNQPGGQVIVSLAVQGPWAVVRIADTGPGIPDDEQARVFDRFYRGAAARARHQTGSGLGLPLAQHLIHLHQGRLDLTSTPGQGTIVTVFLPRHRDATLAH
ncbi:MAG: HAMP domain-containing histidine kinase [Chloroflexi bacterium]|nr:HAMP domain-containing histidine kinase [Chloroflexota bacterium]